MPGFEYKVIPAPAKGVKAPGVKGAEARFAYTLEVTINDLAIDGWEYLRSDILPSEERLGLTSTHTVYRSVLVFRRPVTDGGDSKVSDVMSEPEAVPDDPAPVDVVEEVPVAPGRDEEDTKNQEDETKPA